MLWLLVVVQVVCAGVFVVDLFLSVSGLRQSVPDWRLREALEIAASLGLILGTALGLRAIFQARAAQASAERALRVASGEFVRVVDERMSEWGLTPAERDVAWFSIKGFSTSEMAGLRGTSEGTIKAQCNRIYSKAGVHGRAQLLSTLVEDLLEAGDAA